MSTTGAPDIFSLRLRRLRLQEAIFGTRSIAEWRFDTRNEKEYRWSDFYSIHALWGRRIIGEYLVSLATTIHHNRLSRGWVAATPEEDRQVRVDDLEELWELLDDSRHVPWSYQVEAWKKAASGAHRRGELRLNPYPNHLTSVKYILADIVERAWSRVDRTVFTPEPQDEEEWI